MTRQHIIPPAIQLMKLNESLIRNAHRLPSPVITVGGQAVVYWYGYYLEAYQVRPGLESITSVDVDYVTHRETVEVIAELFNVKPHVQEVFNPPSIAVLDLIDLDTGKVKEDEEGLFLDPRSDETNIIDIIDRPTGFEVQDLRGEGLVLNTERFYIATDAEEISSEKVLVLNPVACIRSRLANATVPMGKDKLIEAERIKALAVPVFNFLLEKFRELEFRESRNYFDYYCRVIWQRQYRRYQVEYNIPLYAILEQFLIQLKSFPHSYNYPRAFVEIELPRCIEHMASEYKRICNIAKKS
ncbi:hypothetical protein GJV11_11935 [Enterobacteriaceae bacterium RIT693]|nr:hypothetical protein [Enterobacteriaceae bacterium RIT693]